MNAKPAKKIAPLHASDFPPISFAGPQWFVVITNPSCENRAQMGIEAAGYRTFMPKLRRWVNHARVKKAVERPLLARYLFVEVDYPRQSFADIRLVNGVECMLAHGGVPCTVPRRFIEDFLRRYMTGEWDFVEQEELPIGARVRIVEARTTSYWPRSRTSRATKSWSSSWTAPKAPRYSR
jgi:transcription antitermination factor NusG